MAMSQPPRRSTRRGPRYFQKSNVGKAHRRGGNSTKFISFLFIVMLIASVKSVWSWIRFQKTYLGCEIFAFLAMEKMADAHFLLAGDALNHQNRSFDFYAMIMDEAGNVLWHRSYGGSKDENLADVVVTADGGFLLVGNTLSYTFDNEEHVSVVRVDSTGNVMWNRTYEGDSDTWAWAAIGTPDGGFLLVGGTDIHGDLNMYGVKINSRGKVMWSRTYGVPTASDFARDVVKTSDGGFLLVGTLWRQAQVDMMVVKIDNQGRLVWSRAYGDNHDEEIFTATETKDHGFLLVGSRSISSIRRDIYVVKINAHGNVLWSRAYGGNSLDTAYHILKTSDGGFLLTGFTSSFGFGEEDGYAVKIQSSGQLVWSRAYGGRGSDWLLDAVETSDGDLISIGYTENLWPAQMGLNYILKTDKSGFSGCNEMEAATQTKNPAVPIRKPNTQMTRVKTHAYIPVIHTGTPSIETFIQCQTSTDSFSPAGLAIWNDDNGNGVWDTGETANVSPAWQNNTSGSLPAIGHAFHLSPPPGVKALFTDTEADYGVVPGGGTADCGTATGNCYVIQSTQNSTEMGHKDVTFFENLRAGATGSTQWTIHLGPSFVDVPVNAFYYRPVEILLHQGLLRNRCNGNHSYFPYNQVYRYTIAEILSWVLLWQAPPASGSGPGGDWDCNDGRANHFTDVPDSEYFCPNVHWLWAHQIIRGCTATEFCPRYPISRAQMAVVLSRAVLGTDPPPSGSGPGGNWDCNDGRANHFTDVPDSESFCPNVHWLWAHHITRGCTANQFCPRQPLNRAQMATFVTRAFHLSLDSP